MGKVKIKTKKTITLHDIGFGLLFIFVLGWAAGIIIDYLWNKIVLSVTLRLFKKTRISAMALERTWHYALIITIIGLLIDWGYYAIIWDPGWVPTMSLAGQLGLIILPMFLLLLANLALCIKYLGLERRPAMITAGVMAFFTAPWVLPIVPRALDWAETS